VAPPGLGGVILAGPTASGKSALALDLAQALASECPVEIVSVDSALVYRGLDIGTAKPTAAERAAVPHHLIDLIEPTESYSAARFVADAQAACSAIRGRGALPLLVGGTMLYVKALREGMDEIPASDPEVRTALDARAAREGWPALHAELARVDPLTAARLAPRDAQRIQRALEVFLTSGRPLSAFQRRLQGSAPSPAEGEPATPADSLAWPVIALEPVSRAWLHERIAARFDAMLDAGLLNEVLALRARGDLHPGLPSMRCVGYRQAWEALDRGTLDGLREAGIAATRQLAKRQLTWLRSTPGRIVVPCDEGAPQHAVRRQVERLWGL
jgi:tRNA dimethylallyltransferase